MKKFISIVLWLFTASMLFVSCEDNPPVEETDLTITVTGMSDCKSMTKSGDANTSCVEYTYYSDDKKLVLKHINTAFNCCPESTSCEISMSGDTIIIEEFEAQSGCDCNCLYDLDIAVEGIKAKEYILKFVEPYRGSQDELIFDINIAQDTIGSYCVERTDYPWGL